MNNNFETNNQGQAGNRPGKDPSRERKSGHLALGIAIVALVAVLAFSAIAGLLVFLFSNKDKVIRREVTQPSQTEAALPEGTTPPLLTEAPDDGEGDETVVQDGVNPEFSLGDLARPAPQAGKTILTIPQIVEKAKPAVVAIYTNIAVSDQFGGLSQNTVSGSGFIISPDGYVVTNAHVIENAGSVHVNLEDGRTYQTAIIGSDPYADIAVLKIGAEGLPYAELGDSSRLLIGELAIAIGNPTGRLSGTVTSGIISALDRELAQTPIALIQTDAALNPGNSGGALLNAYGEVIGINQLKILYSGSSLDQIQGISFAIPVDAAKPIIESIIRTGKYVWPMMGITVSTVERDLASDQGLHYPGVVVVSVEGGGAGSLAGLKAGDVITAFDGTAVETTKELSDLKNTKMAGDEVTLTIYRGTQRLEIRLVLGASS